MTTPTTASNGDGTLSGEAGHARAILLMICAVACFAFLDATAKYLSASLPVLQIVWMRFVIHVALAVLILRIWRNITRFSTNRPILQIGRGAMMLGTTIFNFLALLHLQLAEAATFMFAGPIVVAALAGPLLGEWAGPRRWAAIAVGFLGVLVVTRPGLDGLGWPALLSVVSMTCFALYSLSTRVLAQTESQDGLILYTGLIPAIGLAPFALSVWVWPTDPASWLLMVLTGVFGGGGHWLLIKAHIQAPAPTLAPFMYTQIVWMIALGWLIFADVPTIWTLAGAGSIISSGLYLLYREEVTRRRAKTASLAASGAGTTSSRDLPS
ncbi:MAG: DMT family transporter [Cohaesibacteraceae bacterium]